MRDFEVLRIGLHLMRGNLHDLLADDLASLAGCSTGDDRRSASAGSWPVGSGLRVGLHDGDIFVGHTDGIGDDLGHRGLDALAVRRGGLPRGVDPETGIDSLDLRAALARLSPDDRALLAMRYVAGFNATELAEALGITPSGTRNRLERLTSRLREDLSHG